MIPKTLALDIVTPDKPIVHDDVDEVQLPGCEGAFGVLPGHTPLLALLRSGRAVVPQGRREDVRSSIDFGLRRGAARSRDRAGQARREAGDIDVATGGRGRRRPSAT